MYSSGPDGSMGYWFRWMPQKFRLLKPWTHVRKVEFVAPGERLLNSSSQRTGFMPGGQAARKNVLVNEVQNNMLGIDLMHEDGFTGKT
jgi:hypothetical protein